MECGGEIIIAQSLEAIDPSINFVVLVSCGTVPVLIIENCIIFARGSPNRR